MNLKIPSHTLTSVTGYRKFDSFVPFDADSTVLEFVEVERWEKNEQFSQEIRLASDFADSPLSYVVGLYYFDYDYDFSSNQYVKALLGPVFPYLQTIPMYFYSLGKTTSYAAFAQADYRFSDRLWLTVGARYTDEEKSIRQTFANDPFSAPAANAAKPGRLPPINSAIFNSETFTPKLALNFKPSDDTLIYASYARGFKAGGFNSRAGSFAEAAPYDDESVDSYEVGVKTDLLGNRLRINAAAFYSKISDLQREITFRAANGFPATGTANAGEASYRGVEVEMNWLATDNLRIDFNGGWMDAEYNEFCGQLLRGAHNDPVGPGRTGCDPANPLATDNTDLRIPFVSDYAANLRGTYTLPLSSGGSLRFIGEATYRSDYYLGVANEERGHVDDVTQFSGSVTWSDPEDRFQISVYGQNLSDERFPVIFNNAASLATISFWNAPRTYGVELRAKF